MTFWKKSIGQLARFTAVGASNTAIDLAVTNLLVIATGARSSVALVLISITACALATVNSYVLNRRWTFRETAGQAERGSTVKFVGIAILSLAVNTSMFLFLIRTLPARIGLSLLFSINIAKLGGVAAAFAVSFLGYRFGVFQTDEARRFRGAFRFASAQEASLRLQLAALLLLAAAARFGYLGLTTAVHGDAAEYGWAAAALAAGRPGEIDPVRCNWYCCWESVFHAMGMGLIPSAIAASWIPGLLLIIPVVWMARALYGARVAWLAGALCALHPRLIEYSGNGDDASFCLLAFTTAAAFLVRVIQRGSAAAALGWGAAFGVFAGVRSEALVAFLFSLPLVFWSAAFRSGAQESVPKGAERRTPAGWKTALTLAAAAVLGFALTAATFAAAARGGWIRAAVAGNQVPAPPATQHTASGSKGSGDLSLRASAGSYERAAEEGSLLRRIAGNGTTILERLPGVLLSPIPLFALFLPLLAARRTPVPGDEAPLLLMLLFPLVYYPLTRVESRLLFPAVLPLNIFGAAGLWAFCAYGTRSRRLSAGSRGGTDGSGGHADDAGAIAEPPGFLPARAAWCFLILSAFFILGNLLLSAWRGIEIERGYRHHRLLAQWISRQVDPGEAVVGCGLGYVSTTGYLASRRTLARPLSGRPEDLARFVRERGSTWLILYEPFLRSANPELLSVLDTPTPGYSRVFEVRDEQGRRAQVFLMEGHRAKEAR